MLTNIVIGTIAVVGIVYTIFGEEIELENPWERIHKNVTRKH